MVELNDNDLCHIIDALECRYKSLLKSKKSKDYADYYFDTLNKVIMFADKSN